VYHQHSLRKGVEKKPKQGAVTERRIQSPEKRETIMGGRGQAHLNMKRREKKNAIVEERGGEAIQVRRGVGN